VTSRRGLPGPRSGTLEGISVRRLREAAVRAGAVDRLLGSAEDGLKDQCGTLRTRCPRVPRGGCARVARAAAGDRWDLAAAQIWSLPAS